ncbi:MAG: hypothetical protein IJ365_01625, partial [Clostridia bacterium]|nr:hypothetical protein [Clostridia bacterium]
FGDTVVKTHIHYHFDTNKYMMQVLADAPVNAVSLTAYTPSYFDSAYNDNYNVFEEMRRLVEYYMPLKSLGKAFICYEFDMPTTLSGNFMAAYGCLFAALGVQIANYFTYTPCDVAEYNPGWLVHYFSMCHTPNKSAAFMAGKAIFEAMEFGTELAADDVLWKGENENLSYEINRSTDHVSVITHNSLIYCGGFEGSCNSCPDYIMGTGNSQYIKRSGNGLYILSKNGDGYIFELLPSQKYVGDPFRGKSFRFMANRYVDVNEASVVSRLLETPEKVELNLGFDVTVTDLAGNDVDINNLYPGTYVIKAEWGIVI